MCEEHMAAASYFYQGASLIHLPGKGLEDALRMCEFGKCPEEHQQKCRITHTISGCLSWAGKHQPFTPLAHHSTVCILHIL